MDLTADNMTSKVAPISSDYLISLSDPRVLWNENWLALVLEVVSAILIYQIIKNAKKRQPESGFLVLAAMMATMCFEVLPLLRIGYELWWYHPGLFNIIRSRLPTYVISSFALTLYAADSLTKDANLPTLTRSFLTAIFGVLIMAPCVWMAPRLLLITYHFDDPIFKDRIFNIPVMQILVLLLLFFHTSHLFYENCKDLTTEQRNTNNYILSALQSGVVAAIYTTVEQYVLYIFLKLSLNLPSVTCLLAALTILVFLSKGEIESLDVKSNSMSGLSRPLKNKIFWAVFLGFSILTSIPVFMNFEEIQSTGARLEMGPCHVTHGVSNTNPLDVTRRRFLCSEDTKNLDYDFHCVEPTEVNYAEKDIRKVYTICGKTMMDYLQTTYIIAAYSTICLLIFHFIMRFTFTYKDEKKLVPKKVE